MTPFATVDDMTKLWRPMTAEEQERAAALLELVSDCLRAEAEKVGKNLDEMVSFDPAIAAVAKSVTVDVAARTLMTSTDQEPLSQFTQTAGPYSATGTYLIPGGGLFIKRAELARLGLRRQKIGAVNLYAASEGNDC